MTMAGTNNAWSDSGPFNFERLLDFGISSAENSKPAKQLACARCHGQKLRCTRRTNSVHACDRCLAAKVECVSRQPQRMGRPADTTARHSARADRPHTDRGGSVVSVQSPVAKRRQRCARDPSASLSPTAMVVEYGGAATAHLELDGWAWPSPPTDLPPPAHTGDSARAASDSSSSTPLQPDTGLTSYASSLGSLGTPNTLLPGLEDLSSLFPGAIDVSFFGPQPTPEPSDKADGQSRLEDPVEHLSRLHLELYHCLVSVRSVEKLKKDRLRCISRPADNDIDTSWSENLFHMTERFIEALRDYVSRPGGAPTATTNLTMATAAVDDELNGGEDTGVDGQGPRVDTATGLMIVSCYTRLVQIFDVVVFIVETFKDMDCPGSYVQVSFGAFTPTANKTLQARVLGQYVLHLLEGVSEAVDKAVASRQPYARAVAEVRRNEAKLKERILTTLH